MKKFFLSFILSVAALGYAQADEPTKGIMCTYEGSETTYAFSEVPTVKYVTESGVQYAQLYISGVEGPVESFALAEDKQLIITYAEFSPTTNEGIAPDRAVISEKDGKKVIMGGRIIIISKDGRKFELAGNEIKQ